MNRYKQSSKKILLAYLFILNIYCFLLFSWVTIQAQKENFVHFIKVKICHLS